MDGWIYKENTASQVKKQLIVRIRGFACASVFNRANPFACTSPGLVWLYLEVIFPGCLTSPFWGCHRWSAEIWQLTLESDACVTRHSNLMSTLHFEAIVVIHSGGRVKSPVFPFHFFWSTHCSFTAIKHSGFNYQILLQLENPPVSWSVRSLWSH